MPVSVFTVNKELSLPSCLLAFFTVNKELNSRRVVEVVRGPVGKRRSIMTTVPAHGDLSPRARIYFFVFVVHTMNTMAGAMQFSRG